MIEIKDIQDYIEDAPVKKVKQLALVLSSMLSGQQLAVLETRFTKKVEFNPKVPKKAQKPVPEPSPAPSPKPDDVSDEALRSRGVPPAPVPSSPDLVLDDDLDEFDLN